MFCCNCGKEIAADSFYCNYCGKRIRLDKQGFANSLQIRKSGLSLDKIEDDKKHISFIVISRDQQSISIVEEDIDLIDLYDCFAIIALLRCDKWNDFGYHYNDFYTLGYYNDQLEPMSILKLGRLTIKYVSCPDNAPCWGYIVAEDIRGEKYTFHIGSRDKKNLLPIKFEN